jgi:hypothetical protein
MPLNITLAGATPEKPAQGPAKYVPRRMSPGMHGNTAPIPGADQPPRVAGLPPQPEVPQGTQEGQQEQPGQQGDDITWRLGLVAQKDRKARQRQEAAKAAEARAKTREEALNAREARLAAEEEIRTEWRKNPAKLLRDHGYVPEAALQFMLNGEKLTPEQQLAATMDQRLAEADRKREEDLQRVRDEQAQRDAEREADQAKLDQQALTQEEEFGVQELQADIGAIVEGDPKAFPVLSHAEKKKPGNGVNAIFMRVQEISDEEYAQSGRRIPLTTKLLERAAVEVEEAARVELQESLTDPAFAAAIGLGNRPPPPRRPQTITNRLEAAPERGAQEQPETETQKRARVIAYLDGMRARGWGRT